MHEPQQCASQQRGARLRLIALASTVALAAALPLAAATAGPAPSSGASSSGDPEVSAPPSSPPDASPASLSSSRTPARGAGEPDGARGAQGGAQRPGGDVDGAGESAGEETVTECGPELASPDGVEAQTCVVSEGGEIWARSYYRNATNGPLSGVLTLMRPDGSSVQVPCELDGASDEPGICETPRERTREGVRDARGAERAGKRGREGGGPAYSAVLEIGSPDGERLLLRSGSNSSAP
ncbi:hypothetical protein [Streptomyces daliensis]|uniref:Uncharacterized protein n=1 Tax=Streptomyces daliensis TaxID=299421 RepID=A0A8T4J3M3_9ACTN|nr:hypothetical protein [Streptomyces daliensis]